MGDGEVEGTAASLWLAVMFNDHRVQPLKFWNNISNLGASVVILNVH